MYKHMIHREGADGEEERHRARRALSHDSRQAFNAPLKANATLRFDLHMKSRADSVTARRFYEVAT